MGKTKVVNQVRAKSLELMIVAFGFVAGGVWRDAIVKWMDGFSPVEGATAIDLTIAAVIVTFVVVVMIILLTKVLGEKEEEKKE